MPLDIVEELRKRKAENKAFLDTHMGRGAFNNNGDKALFAMIDRLIDTMIGVEPETKMPTNINP